MSRSINKEIELFIAGINRGPLKSLIVDKKTISMEYLTPRDDIYKIVVEQAWLDMNRTLVDNKKKSVRNKRSEAKGYLAGKLKDYFDKQPKKTEEAFDGYWYSEVISNIVDSQILSIGQTQKLINMSFKYLYCCKWFFENKKDYFKYCHMPLDGYILNWYKREIDKEYDGQAWSKIDNVSKYMNIENKIRNYYDGEIVLEKEFDIWMHEKKKAEKKKLLSYVNKIIKSPECSPELKILLSEYSKKLESSEE